LRLTPFLRADARVGARRVDQGDDRPAELVRHLHQAQRLAVPLRVRHPEVAAEVLLHVPPLLLPDDHDGLALQPRPAPHDRLVIPEAAVAVELNEVRERALDVIQGVWPLGMARELNALDGAQPAHALRLEPLQLALQHADLFRDVQAPGPRHLLEPRDLLLQLRDVSLEIQWRGNAHACLTLSPVARGPRRTARVAPTATPASAARSGYGTGGRSPRRRGSDPSSAAASAPAGAPRRGAPAAARMPL